MWLLSLYKKENAMTEMPYDTRRRDCSNATQGKLQIDGHHQKLGWDNKEFFYPESQRECGPPDIFISDFLGSRTERE